MKPMNFPGRKDQRRREAIERMVKASKRRLDTFSDVGRIEKLTTIINNTAAKLKPDAHLIRTKKGRTARAKIA